MFVAGKTAVGLAIEIAVPEFLGEVGMVDVHPAVGVPAAVVLQDDGIEPRVVLEHGRAAVLRIRLRRGQGKGIMMRAGTTTGELEPDDGAEMLGEPEFFDVGRPVVEAIVLGGGRKFDVLGSEVDESVVCATLVIAAGRGVIVEIRAHPAGGVDQPLEAASHRRKFTGLHGEFAHEMAMLNAARDDQSIHARIKRHVKLAGFRVPLVHATVCAILRAEIRGRRAVEAAELHLAGDGVAAGIGDVQHDPGEGGELLVEYRGLITLQGHLALYRGSTAVGDAHAVFPVGQVHGKFPLAQRISR